MPLRAKRWLALCLAGALLGGCAGLFPAPAPPTVSVEALALEADALRLSLRLSPQGSVLRAVRLELDAGTLACQPASEVAGGTVFHCPLKLPRLLGSAASWRRHPPGALALVLRGSLEPPNREGDGAALTVERAQRIVLTVL